MEIKRLSISHALKTGFKNLIDNAILLLLKINGIFIATVLCLMLLFLGIFLNVFMLAPFIFGIYIVTTMSLGYTRIALEINDTGTSKVDTLFSCVRIGFKYFCAFILYILAVALGLLLLVFPGIYLIIRLCFFKQIMVDQNAGPIESLKKSWDLTSGQTGNIFILLLIVWAIGGIGHLTIIGLVIIAPFAELIMVNAYRQLQGRENIVEDKPIS